MRRELGNQHEPKRNLFPWNARLWDFRTAPELGLTMCRSLL
jgi:hypothetical protein